MVACRGFVRRQIYESFTKTYALNFKKRRSGAVGKVIRQKFGTCFGISLVRHFSALLKLKGHLKPHEELSIEEFFQLIRHYYPHACTPEDKYGLGHGDLEEIEQVLKHHGLVLDSVNPLRFHFETLKVYDSDKPPHRYTIGDMSVVFQSDFSVAEFEKKLLKALKKSPLACTVLMFESYEWLRGKELFDPDFSREKPQVGHCMLMVAHGRVWSGRLGRFRPFFEFQDSNGPSIGHKGYLRVRRGRKLINSYFTFKV